MKAARYFICCICIVFCLVMTNELRTIYFHRVITADNTHFQLTENSISQTELEKLAEQFDVFIYNYNKTEDIHSGETVFDIYTSAQADSYFPSDLFCNKNSVFYGKVRVNMHTLQDKNETESAYYNLKGNAENRANFLALLQRNGFIEKSGINTADYTKTYLFNILLMWCAAAIFLLLLSVYCVSITKREQMIAVTYGKSLAAVVLSHILTDGFIIGGICCIASLLVKRTLYLSVNREVLSYLGLILVLCLLPNALYGIFELKLLKNENKSLRRTVRLSVCFKWCASICLVPIFVMELTYISELYHAYQAVGQLDFMNQHEIIQLQTQDTSLVPEEVLDELKSDYANRILYNHIYKEYLESNHIVVLDGDKLPIQISQNSIIMFCIAIRMQRNTFAQNSRNFKKR